MHIYTSVQRNTHVPCIERIPWTQKVCILAK